MEHPALTPQPTPPQKNNSSPCLQPWAPCTPRQPTSLHLISTKAHRTFNFCFEFPLFKIVSRAKQFEKLIPSVVGIFLLNLPASQAVAALVFPLLFYGSVFPLADLCLGAANIKRAFWCRPGCLHKCRNAGHTSTPSGRKRAKNMQFEVHLYLFLKC